MNGTSIKNYDDEIAQLKIDSKLFRVRMYINGVYTELNKCDYYIYGNQAYIQAWDYPGQEGVAVTIANFTLNS